MQDTNCNMENKCNIWKKNKSCPNVILTVKSDGDNV